MKIDLTTNTPADWKKIYGTRKTRDYEGAKLRSPGYLLDKLAAYWRAEQREKIRFVVAVVDVLVVVVVVVIPVDDDDGGAVSFFLCDCGEAYENADDDYHSQLTGSLLVRLESPTSPVGVTLSGDGWPQNLGSSK